jgi:hypothetical protein
MTADKAQMSAASPPKAIERCLNCTINCMKWQIGALQATRFRHKTAKGRRQPLKAAVLPKAHKANIPGYLDGFLFGVTVYPLNSVAVFLHNHLAFQA